MKEKLTIKELSPLIRYSFSTIRKFKDEEGMPHEQTGKNGKVYYYLEDVQKWLEDNKGVN